MAKSGFSVSQRRKVEVISAAKTVAVHDCGTSFAISADISGGGAIAIVLPSAASAGDGWHCKIHLGAQQSNHINITLDGGGNFASQLRQSADNAAAGITSPDAATVRFVAGGAGAQAGDVVEFIVLNGGMHSRGLCSQ